MTYQAIFGGTVGRHFATIRGYGDFIRWTKQLDAGDFFLVVHLADHGWTMRLPDFRRELEVAIEAYPPDDPDLQKTLDGFLPELKANEDKFTSMMITDGMGEDDGENGPWWVDGKLVDPLDADDVAPEPGEDNDENAG